MISRWSAESLARHCRKAEPFSFFARVGFGIVSVILDLLCRLVVELFLRPAPQRRQGLEARDTQHPCRGGGTALELPGLPPDVEEYLADQVFRRRFVAHQPQNEPVHTNMVPRVQHLHGEPVATCDPRDQNFVRSRLHRRTIGSCMGRLRGRRGSSQFAEICMHLPAPGGALRPVSSFRALLGKPNGLKIPTFTRHMA